MKKKTSSKKKGKTEVEKMEAEIKKAVKEADPEAGGVGVMEMMLKKIEGLNAVGDFLDMVCLEEITLSETYYARLNYIWVRSTWGCPRNMKIRFGIGVEFNVKKFCKIMAKAITSIKAIK